MIKRFEDTGAFEVIFEREINLIASMSIDVATVLRDEWGK